MKKKVMASAVTAILGSGLLIGVTVFANEGNSSENVNTNTEEIKVGNVESEDVLSEIDTIKANGFDITLPAQVPEHTKHVTKTSKKDVKGTEVAVTHLGDQNDKEEHKWKIQLLQEKLPNDVSSEKAMQVIEERYASKDIEEIKIGNYKAFIEYTSNKGDVLNEIWLATDDYFYSIGSPFLTKSELIEVASSMDFD
ncbi:hypothetical protein [Oceanobacillus profundus]|uniref:hypothetical protein n=1 Tax=Oceanobacillus TaxID=182709 RepID=UPI000BA5720B|nr:hypothetical protein [Oceanobacillus profundus]MDO6447997.1 hypothetical protein [Oceanobacillus profundus]PAE27181.1 hypothetical protein CHI07_21125 [Paenibacillus sp. 7884-2]